MQPQSDYKQLLTEVIKKQIVILGPDITLAKARNVPGLTVSDDGTVTEITGEPQQITQSLIDQFVQLSGLIVKKTMEPLLSYHAEETPKETTPPAPATPIAAQMPEKPVTPPVSPTTNPVSAPAATPPMPSVTPLTTSTVTDPKPGGMPLPSVDHPTPTMPEINPAQPTPPVMATEQKDGPKEEHKEESMPLPMPAQPTPTMENKSDQQAAPQANTDQIDAETQKIIDEALKQNS